MRFMPLYGQNLLVPAGAVAAYVTGNRSYKGKTASSSVGLFSAGTVTIMMDGRCSDTPFFNTVSASAHFMKVDLGTAAVVNSAVWYQSDTSSHGVWKWQGSNDDSAYTDIGTSFTLGGAVLQTHTQLNGNSTAYRYYRLQGVSGTANTNPWLRGLELNGPGVVVVTISASTTVLRLPLNLVDGSIAGTDAAATYFATGFTVTSSFWFKFDFGSAVVVKEAKWYQDATSSHGVWKWQGSNDDSGYTDIGTSFTLGGATTQTQTQLNANVTAYRYYRLIGVSGTASTTPFLEEIEFKQ